MTRAKAAVTAPTRTRKTKRTQLEIIRHYIKRVTQLDHYGTFLIDEKANHDYETWNIKLKTMITHRTQFEIFMVL